MSVAAGKAGPAAMGRALLLWQRAAGPYWPYVCAAPFVSAASAPPGGRLPLEPRLRDLLLPLAGPGSAVVVDLPPAATVALAPALSAAGAAVVPVVQRWCAPGALLPARPLVARLLGAAEQLSTPRGNGVVLLLDGERAGRPGAHTPPDRFDNRYDYPACRFPPPSLLRRHGVQRVLWVGRGIASDLRGYAAGLAVAGLAPLVVDPG